MLNSIAIITSGWIHHHLSRMILSRTVLFHSSRNANARLYGSKAFCCSRARQSFGRPLLNLPATATNATSFAARSSFSSNANAENAYSNTYIITKKERSAYRTLGVSVSSTYEEVKGTFLKLALKHHPDKTGKNSVDEFVKYRTAFETIRKRVVKRPANEDEDDDDDTAADWNDEEMQTWFYEETGEFLSFQMDQDTIDEVIKAFTTLSPGGRDPGEWEMARQLTEREARRKAGDLDDDDDDDGPLLQLTGSMNSGTTIRRRQRRWSR